MFFSKNKKDLAIGIVLFNPVRSKRIIMNYLYMVNLLKIQNIPVFTLELVFEDRDPEIPDVFHVRSNSYMFHKERLCRVLETKIPKEYTKLAFLDADIIFKRQDWYTAASDLLNTHDVVHLFEECEWLDLTYTEVMLKRKSIYFMKGLIYDSSFHPGFGWAFRRDWYNKVGFFDYAISGSGDTLSCAGWMKKRFSEKFKSLPHTIREEFFKFYEQESPRLTVLEGTIQHLYHGSRNNRQYVKRHTLLDIQQNIHEVVRLNKDRVYEWIEPRVWNPLFLDYFTTRNDDDVSVKTDGIPVVTNPDQCLTNQTDTIQPYT